ncbi:hypothetical protein JHK86_053780 [Glycine max]|nr:hypothetical protein JHK86_053780 [Glycine max]
MQKLTKMRIGIKRVRSTYVNKLRIKYKTKKPPLPKKKCRRRKEYHCLDEKHKMLCGLYETVVISINRL